MGLDGLVIPHPRDRILDLKITSRSVWMRFTEIDSLDMASDLFYREAKTILSILDVERLSRIGWRNYFVYEFGSQELHKAYIDKLGVLQDCEISKLTVKLSTRADFDAILALDPVARRDEPQALGILFDVDVYQHGDFTPTDIGPVLKGFRKYLSGQDEFLRILNSTFDR